MCLVVYLVIMELMWGFFDGFGEKRDERECAMEGEGENEKVR